MVRAVNKADAMLTLSSAL